MSYGTHVTLEAPFTDAVARVRAALAAHGFGVLTEIDVTATMRAKLGEQMEDYVILGACNPPFAHQALGIDRSIGLLLPCNVVVRATGDRTVVEAVDPQVMVTLTGRAELKPVADQVARSLTAALAEAPPGEAPLPASGPQAPRLYLGEHNSGRWLMSSTLTREDRAPSLAAGRRRTSPGLLLGCGGLRVGEPVDGPGQGIQRGDGGGQRPLLAGGERGQGQVQDRGVGCLPGEYRLLPGFGHGQLDGTPVAGGGGAAHHSPRGEGVDDRRHGIGPHVQQPCQLAGPGTRVVSQRAQQLQLRHRQRVARIGDPRATPQCTAQPGDSLGQPLRPRGGVQVGTAALPGLTAGPCPWSRGRARPGARHRRPDPGDGRQRHRQPGAGGMVPREPRGVQPQRHDRHAQRRPDPPGHVHHPARRRGVPLRERRHDLGVIRRSVQAQPSPDRAEIASMPAAADTARRAIPATPARSRPARTRVRGSRNHPAATAAAPTGTFSRNTHRQ